MKNWRFDDIVITIMSTGKGGGVRILGPCTLMDFLKNQNCRREENIPVLIIEM
jgi:hypothetical protein